MSWNETGDQNKDKKKDPWERKEDGPPNIDEALRQLQERIRAFFGKSGGSHRAAPPTSGPGKTTASLFLISVIALLVYAAAGFFVVQPAQEAVVTRFGRYIRTEGAGPHWIMPLIEAKKKVNVQEVLTSKRGGPMLTKDENIVNAEIAVQYRIANPRYYLFNLVHPVRTLEQVTDSALRTVVGQSTLNEVLTSGRSEIGLEIRKQVQHILDRYQSGLQISDLAVQQTKAPEEVKAAFDDAIKAQQDEERLVNEAHAYAQKVLPIAEGRAKRILEEASAYKEKVTLEAEGKTSKFSQLLPEYQRFPRVTRDRLYMDALQQVYENTPKVLVDVTGGNNLMYLPLDKLIAPLRTAMSRENMEQSDQKEEESTASNHVVRAPQSAPLSRMITRPSYDELEASRRGGE